MPSADFQAAVKASRQLKAKPSNDELLEVRPLLLVGSCLISFIGAGIAPGSQTIYRLIAAQVLIGFGFAVVPLAYAVPSEILPRRWRTGEPQEATFKSSS